MKREARAQYCSWVHNMPLVCITGDVHHRLGHPCHPMIPAHTIQKKEYVFAGEYSNVLRKYDFRATLFVTGKCIAQHKPFWTDFLSLDLVELGAHTHTAFQPWIIHEFFEQVLNSRYGPCFYQYLDMKRVLGAFKSIGVKPKAWRTHAYAGNSITYQLLERFGFSTVSDRIRLGSLKITNIGKLKQIPITSIPDEKIAYFYFQGMNERMMMEAQEVMQFIVDLILKRKHIVLQLHPICMKVLDNFRNFEKMLRMLSDHAYTSVTITELNQVIGCQS